MTLVEELPLGSRFQGSIKDDPTFVGWGRAEYVLAQTYDLIAATAQVTWPHKKPPTYPLPGQVVKPAGTKLLDLFKSGATF